METNTETDQTADTDASESNLLANRRRRSRRRRTDNEATLMDGESDNASVSENGIGKQATRFTTILGVSCLHKRFGGGLHTDVARRRVTRGL